MNWLSDLFGPNLPIILLGWLCFLGLIIKFVFFRSKDVVINSPEESHQSESNEVSPVFDRRVVVDLEFNNEIFYYLFYFLSVCIISFILSIFLYTLYESKFDYQVFFRNYSDQIYLPFYFFLSFIILVGLGSFYRFIKIASLYNTQDFIFDSEKLQINPLLLCNDWGWQKGEFYIWFFYSLKEDLKYKVLKWESIKEVEISDNWLSKRYKYRFIFHTDEGSVFLRREQLDVQEKEVIENLKRFGNVRITNKSVYKEPLNTRFWKVTIFYIILLVFLFFLISKLIS